jgi:hypothetical protein
MSDDQDTPRSEADAELEREIRKGRKFTLAEAIGRLAGPGAMKGVSPVTRKQQAAVEIYNWLTEHMPVGNGELHAVLLRHVEGGANSCSTTLSNRSPSWPPAASGFLARTTS